ncbi:MAG: heavy metal translocating P-type ATPase [Parvularcula sp.]|jgi:Cu2+-exporting ATPase|nr:heavy metal translocating P-type ATPase [Parvularcula sp.]
MSAASESLGCPSGLAPSRDEAVNLDPTPFISEKAGQKSLELAVTGAKCAGCIGKIERAVSSLPGVTSGRLNLSSGKLAVSWNGPLHPQRIVEAVTSLGYSAVPYDPVDADDDDQQQGRFLLRCLAVAGFASANIMLLSVSVWATSGAEMGEATRSLMHLISALIAIPTVAFSGRPFFASAWSALKNKRANMDVPISLAVFLALGVSLFESLLGGEHAYFDAAVMLLFFLLIGRWLDHRLRRQARGAANDLLALQATSALRIGKDGRAEAVAARDIAVGDHLVLMPGARLPVNAEVLSGRSDIDTAFLTGESEPQYAEEGQFLYAGTRNISAKMTVRATADVAHSLVAELMRLVEAGQQAKDRYTILADKAARLYVPVVHTLAALTFVGWMVFAEGGLRDAVMAATAVLIITCPCALGLATPAVQVVATGQLFRRGILVKSGNALERLAKIDHVIFDKTGTLTTGKLEWLNPDDLPDDAYDAAARLARGGFHPVARAVTTKAGPGALAQDVEEVPGQGLQGVIDGKAVRLGRAEFVGLSGSTAKGGSSEAWLKIGDQPPHRLLFADKLREGAEEAVARLRKGGLRISLLSGDHQGAVAPVADALHISDVRAAVTPQEKAEIVRQRKEDSAVAMVGDGINDAAALALADVALSPGSAADAAQSAADFVYQRDGLGAVEEAWTMARRARRHILQNFAFAAAYNAVAAPAAMIGLVSPLVAALAMSGSSLVVTLNALRLMGGTKP